MAKQIIQYAKLNIPLGLHLWIARSARGVCRIEFAHSESEFLAVLVRHWPNARLIKNSAALRKPLKQLVEYFVGRRREFTFPRIILETVEIDRFVVLFPCVAK